MKKSLLFVYNADSGLFNTVTDFAHKIFSPATYPCHLCALTYGNFTIKQEWKNFIETLPFPTLFLHKNDFLHQYKTAASLPAVFINSDDGLKQILSKEEIERSKDLDELKKRILQKLGLHAQHHHTHV